MQMALRAQVVVQEGGVVQLRCADLPAGAAAQLIVLLEGVPAPSEQAPDEAGSESGPRMAQALASLAARGGPADFGDPLAWERDTRVAPAQPGRDG